MTTLEKYNYQTVINIKINKSDDQIGVQFEGGEGEPGMQYKYDGSSFNAEDLIKELIEDIDEDLDAFCIGEVKFINNNKNKLKKQQQEEDYDDYVESLEESDK